MTGPCTPDRAGPERVRKPPAADDRTGVDALVDHVHRGTCGIPEMIDVACRGNLPLGPYDAR
jgi:hypothetical protein